MLTAIVSSGNSDTSSPSNHSKVASDDNVERTTIYEGEPKGLLPVISSGTHSGVDTEKCAALLSCLKLLSPPKYKGKSAFAIDFGNEHPAVSNKLCVYKLPVPEFVNPVPSMASFCNEKAALVDTPRPLPTPSQGQYYSAHTKNQLSAKKHWWVFGRVSGKVNKLKKCT